MQCRPNLGSLFFCRCSEDKNLNSKPEAELRSSDTIRRTGGIRLINDGSGEVVGRCSLLTASALQGRMLRIGDTRWTVTVVPRRRAVKTKTSERSLFFL